MNELYERINRAGLIDVIFHAECLAFIRGDFDILITSDSELVKKLLTDKHGNIVTSKKSHRGTILDGLRILNDSLILLAHEKNIITKGVQNGWNKDDETIRTGSLTEQLNAYFDLVKNADEEAIKKSMNNVLDLFEGTENTLDDVMQDYDMDYDLLVHFLRVEKILKRLCQKQFRSYAMRNVEIPNIEGIFHYDSLILDREQLNKSKYKKDLVNSKFRVQNLNGQAFKFVGQAVEGTLSKGYEADKLQLYEYYNLVTNSYVKFFIEVVNRAYNEYSTYTLMRIKDVSNEKLDKVGLYTGVMNGVVDLPEVVTHNMQGICDSIYSKDKGFNKASMLVVLELLKAILSKENVSLQTIKRGVFRK